MSKDFRGASFPLILRDFQAYCACWKPFECNFS